MAVNKDFGKKAIVNLYEEIMESVCDYINTKEKRTGENVTLDNFSEADWFTVMTEYIEDGVKVFLSDKIKTAYNSDYLIPVADAGTKILKLILDNKDERTPSIRWDFLYEQIIAELEKLFGGKIHYWVNVYHVTREFGGHEEGGWYYDWYECVESVPATLEQIEIVEEELERRHGDGEGDISSVLGGYKVIITVDDLKAENQDTEVPHYE